MRLRRVVVSGFKTFARRSEVRLEPGITAIVGPNGSGKSNLVDAIRWALGETNARELRGARMDEVIYSGGGGRVRMGVAEVELILDNEDGRLAVDDIEVAVSRRVVRHGDSEFRLNGDRVRLRDLERVLGTTGLTQSGYAVVAQNDIDAIIEATPAQRRALVEQAAGVRSLRAATEDALARVGQAEVTLRRFEDLLGETEPRLAELAGQAALALEQRALSDQLSQLRGSLAREAWRAARAQLKLAQRRLDAAGHRLEAAATAENAFADRLARHREHLERQRAENAQAARRLEEARLAMERAAGDQRRLADRLRAAVLGRASADARLRAAATEHEAARSGLDDPVPATAGESDAARALTEARAQHAAEAADLARAETAAAAAEAALRAVEVERLDADAASRRTATQLRLFSEAATALERRVVESEQALTGFREAAERASAERSRAAEAAGTAARVREESASTAAAARASAADAEAALHAAADAARVALSRAAALRGQVDGALGGRGAVADAVSAGALAARRLIDLFAVVDEADRAAVEAALEGHLGAWVVDDLDAAAALLEAGVAREEILAADSAPSPSPSAPPGARSVVDAVRVEPSAAAAFAACAAGAWLVQDRADARRVVELTGGRAVLSDGMVVTAAGLRGGGRPGRTLELAAAEHDASARADEALSAERAAQRARAAAAERLAAADTQERKAVEALQVTRVEEARTAAVAQAAGQRLAMEEERARAARAELAASTREREALAGAEGSAAERLQAVAVGVETAQADASAAREWLANRRSAAAQAADALRRAETDAARAEAEMAERRRRHAEAERAAAAAAGRCRHASLAVLDAELEVLAALAHSRRCRGTLVRSEVESAEALARLDATAPELAQSERAVAALDAERSEIAVVLARAEDERGAAAEEVRAAEERVAELADAVRGDDDDEGPEPDAGDADRAEREIVRLERRVAALGPVNALAPEQHDELAARVAVLRAGRDDLGSACADIREMAQRLTAAIDARFDAVFGAVSVHFHELFAELFPGGRATLRREEPAPTDDDETGQQRTARVGVEILAQPPGKRLQPLSLFSGGERALTALAVILALQQVNPSPFYVFDEVDAPLDDSNVLRFTRLLKRLAEDQQFIVVTHNHITMAAADALHGVTSDGEGVSSVISVRFDAELGETVPEGNVVGLRQSTIRAAV